MDNIDYGKCVDLRYPVEVHSKVYWRKLRSDHILKYFGVGGKDGSGPIPPTYNAVKMIGDTCVSILPQGTPWHSRRVVAQCKHCLEWVCAGHLDQHQKGKFCTFTQLGLIETPKVRYLK